MIKYLLRDKNVNNVKTRESKEKVRQAWQTYQNGRGYHTYKDGKKIGSLITDAMFVYSERPDARKASYFARGLKNGIKSSFIYWIPGIMARDLLKKGLFKNNSAINNKNASPGPRTVIKRTTGRTTKRRMVQTARYNAYRK